MKNQLTDLNNLLFAQLERVCDESVRGEELQEEIGRSQTICDIAQTILNTANLSLRAKMNAEDHVRAGGLPGMLACVSQTIEQRDKKLLGNGSETLPGSYQ